MNMTMISGALAFILGVLFTVFSLLLPEASIGIPNAPKVFPAALGILMIGCSLLLMLQESFRIKRAGKAEGVAKNPYMGKIFLTCVFGVIYGLLFDSVGYVISTFIFLQAELWLFNGVKNWKTNTLVAFIFSFFMYILFAKLLGIYLPMMPGIWF